jgi:hypothetical protein
MIFPKSVQELGALVTNKVQENVQLEYKASAALSKASKLEMAKDASAFANSDGGVLVYGIAEDQNHDPDRLDGGVDHSLFSAEWIEQVLQSNISPRLDGVEIVPIRASNTHSYYAVRIPKSFRGPHQDRNSHKYYKRFGYNILAMEDYEIADVRNRITLCPPLVSFTVETQKRFMCYLLVQNVGTVPAYEVTFEFSPEPLWSLGRQKPPALERGIKCLPPGKKHWFFYHTFPELLGKESPWPSSVSVGVSYLHPQFGQRLREEFYINLEDYRESTSVESDVYVVGEILEKHISELTKEVHALNESLKAYSSIVGATGLDLSFSTLQGLRRLLKGEEPVEPVSPLHVGYRAFQEILGVDLEVAIQLERHFWSSDKPAGIESISNMTDQAIEKFNRYFQHAPRHESPQAGGIDETDKPRD